MADGADREALRRRLALGEDNPEAWLDVAEVAELFAFGSRSPTRFAVGRWLKKGVTIEGQRFVIRYRTRPEGRICHPTDVIALLEATEQVRSADNPASTDPADSDPESTDPADA